MLTTKEILTGSPVRAHLLTLNVRNTSPTPSKVIELDKPACNVNDTLLCKEIVGKGKCYVS